jgi:hypothetical protein
MSAARIERALRGLTIATLFMITNQHLQCQEHIQIDSVKKPTAGYSVGFVVTPKIQDPNDDEIDILGWGAGFTVRRYLDDWSTGVEATVSRSSRGSTVDKDGPALTAMMFVERSIVSVTDLLGLKLQVGLQLDFEGFYGELRRGIFVPITAFLTYNGRAIQYDLGVRGRIGSFYGFFDQLWIVLNISFVLSSDT